MEDEINDEENIELESDKEFDNQNDYRKLLIFVILRLLCF